MKITMLGSGAWGTALANLLCENGHQVTLWSRSAEKAAAMEESRVNPVFKVCPFIRPCIFRPASKRWGRVRWWSLPRPPLPSLRRRGWSGIFCPRTPSSSQ